VGDTPPISLHGVHQIRKLTGRVFKLRSRTRAVLVLLGCIGLLTAWFLPMYEVIYWLKSPAALHTAIKSGHYEAIGQLDAPSLVRKYGNDNLLQIGYTGSALAHGGTATRPIGISQKDFFYLVGLGGLALLAVWTDEWIRGRGIARYLKKVIDFGVWLGVLYEIFKWVWKAGDATSLSVVNKMSTALMMKDLHGHDGGAAAVVHVHPALSVGWISVVIGLFLASVGMLTSSSPEPDSSSALGVSEVTKGVAALCVIAGLIYLVLNVALFSQSG
jgi:hypothetical protein